MTSFKLPYDSYVNNKLTLVAEVRKSRRRNFPAIDNMSATVLVVGNGGREHALAWKVGMPTTTAVYARATPPFFQTYAHAPTYYSYSCTIFPFIPTTCPLIQVAHSDKVATVYCDGVATQYNGKVGAHQHLAPDTHPPNRTHHSHTAPLNNDWL